MAESNVTLRVRADTSDARREVKETTGDIEKMNAAAKKTQGAANAATGGGGSGGGTGTPPVDTKQAARDMADEFGKRAGAAMGKLLVSFMVNQGVGTAFSLMRKPGEDSRRIDQVESTVQGAITWGGTGATIAGPAGAAVGALLGGLNAFILKEKEIQDALAKSRVDYNRERREAEVSSAMRQEERAYDWMLSRMTPEGQGESLRNREKELSGGGRRGAEIFDEYMRLIGERADAGRMINALSMANGRNAAANKEIERQSKEVAARAQELDAEIKRREAMFEQMAAGNLVDNNGNPLEFGGNKAGTRNWYEAAKFYAEYRYGENANETKDIQSRLSAVNAQIDPLKEKELGVYLGELDKVMGLAGRQAITDSASSKGLGVGAQIGGMANDRVITKMDELIKAMRTSNKDMVDLLRPYFQNGGAANFLSL